jgi:hypothetical protein
MTPPKDRIIVASDVNERDGIGLEVYRNDELVIEIFRDDTLKTRTVAIFKPEVSLELMEKAISDFKEKIPREFINYDET